MALLPIIKIGHPTLRKIAAKVEIFDGAFQELVERMIETMRVNEGIGLAAPQVNVKKRFFVIDKHLIDEEMEAQVYVNPEIISQDGSGLLEEGCLSIPGIRAEVARPDIIRVRYQKIDGEEVTEELKGLLARVFQHEYDHLNGILFIDRIPILKRKLLEPQIKELEGANIIQ
jgi:peptide deformylase